MDFTFLRERRGEGGRWRERERLSYVIVIKMLAPVVAGPRIVLSLFTHMVIVATGASRSI